MDIATAERAIGVLSAARHAFLAAGAFVPAQSKDEVLADLDATADDIRQQLAFLEGYKSGWTDCAANADCTCGSQPAPDPRWRDVTEDPPTKRGTTIVCYLHSGVPDACYFTPGKGFDVRDGLIPTHWMPCPAPPQQGEPQ